MEESLTDDCRVALVFSSQGLPLSLGKDALDAVETKYDLILPTVADKDKFIDEVACARFFFACCRTTFWQRWDRIPGRCGSVPLLLFLGVIVVELFVLCCAFVWRVAVSGDGVSGDGCFGGLLFSLATPWPPLCAFLTVPWDTAVGASRRLYRPHPRHSCVSARWSAVCETGLSLRSARGYGRCADFCSWPVLLLAIGQLLAVKAALTAGSDPLPDAHGGHGTTSDPLKGFLSPVRGSGPAAPSSSSPATPRAAVMSAFPVLSSPSAGADAGAGGNGGRGGGGGAGAGATNQLGVILENMRAQRQGLAVLGKQLTELRNDILRFR